MGSSPALGLSRTSSWRCLEAQLLHLPRGTEVISILEVWLEMLGGTRNEIPSFLLELLLR